MVLVWLGACWITTSTCTISWATETFCWFPSSNLPLALWLTNKWQRPWRKRLSRPYLSSLILFTNTLQVKEQWKWLTTWKKYFHVIWSMSNRDVTASLSRRILALWTRTFRCTPNFVNMLCPDEEWWELEHSWWLSRFKTWSFSTFLDLNVYFKAELTLCNAVTV